MRLFGLTPILHGYGNPYKDRPNPDNDFYLEDYPGLALFEKWFSGSTQVDEARLWSERLTSLKPSDFWDMMTEQKTSRNGETYVNANTESLTFSFDFESNFVSYRHVMNLREPDVVIALGHIAWRFDVTIAGDRMPHVSEVRPAFYGGYGGVAPRGWQIGESEHFFDVLQKHGISNK